MPPPDPQAAVPNTSNAAASRDAGRFTGDSYTSLSSCFEHRSPRLLGSALTSWQSSEVAKLVVGRVGQAVASGASAPAEERPGSTGQGGGQQPPGAIRGTVPQKANRRGGPRPMQR